MESMIEQSRGGPDDSAILAMAGGGMRVIGPCPHQEDVLVFVDWNEGKCTCGCAYRFSAITAGRRTGDEDAECETCEIETAQWTADCPDADTLGERARMRGWRVFEQQGAFGPGLGPMVAGDEKSGDSQHRTKEKMDDTRRRRRKAQRRARRRQRRR